MQKGVVDQRGLSAKATQPHPPDLVLIVGREQTGARLSQIGNFEVFSARVRAHQQAESDKTQQ